MATLVLFLLLLAFAAVLMWRLGIGIARLRRVAIGGVEEDLDAARRTMGLTAVRALVLAATILAIIFVGERWAAQWRGTLPGALALTLVSLAAGGAFVWTWVFTVVQQWSRTGTLLGVVRGVVYGLIAWGVVMLTFHWRWG